MANSYITNKKSITGKVIIAKQVPIHDKYPEYEGAYIIDPLVTEQSLPTAQKSMEEDMTINAIHYDEVENLGGGKTATIGMI